MRFKPFRLCSHLHISKLIATRKENMCFVMCLETATHVAFVLPFIHICAFPNARQSTRKRTARLHYHSFASVHFWMYGNPQENAHHARLFKNTQQCALCLCYHLLASSHFRTHSNPQEKVMLFCALRKQKAMRSALAVQFVCICVFPNAQQAARKHMLGHVFENA